MRIRQLIMSLYILDGLIYHSGTLKNLENHYQQPVNSDVNCSHRGGGEAVKNSSKVSF